MAIVGLVVGVMGMWVFGYMTGRYSSTHITARLRNALARSEMRNQRLCFELDDVCKEVGKKREEHDSGAITLPSIPVPGASDEGSEAELGAVPAVVPAEHGEP